MSLEIVYAITIGLVRTVPYSLEYALISAMVVLDLLLHIAQAVSTMLSGTTSDFADATRTGPENFVLSTLESVTQCVTLTLSALALLLINVLLVDIMLVQTSLVTVLAMTSGVEVSVPCIQEYAMIYVKGVMVPPCQSATNACHTPPGTHTAGVYVTMIGQMTIVAFTSEHALHSVWDAMVQLLTIVTIVQLTHTG